MSRCHCLASVTYLNEVGRGLKLAFWEHQIHWCTFIGNSQGSYWFLQLGEMFEPSGRWFPENAGIMSDLLESKDFKDTSIIQNRCLFDFESWEDEFDLDCKKFLKDAVDDFKAMTTLM